MRKSWRDGLFRGTAALGIVLAAVLFITGSIRSQAADTLKAQEEYYEQLEREYLDRVKSFLTEQGYRNSGVTLSRVVDSEGQRSYTIWVHHSGLARLEDGKLAELLGQIENLGTECIGMEATGNTGIESIGIENIKTESKESYVPGCSFTAQQLR